MPLLKLAEHYFYILSRFFRVDSFFRPFRFALCHSSLYQKVKSNGYDQIVLHLTQEEIASRLGTVREMVGRALRTLKMEGVIQYRSEFIYILDREQLIAHAEF
ncbi:helix-turn-helix domain-containing protein [Chloroflexi bacterium TSY]|nr:helix-turn-helix domain-containing protein [Chloroflexi bacterium TSY]